MPAEYEKVKAECQSSMHNHKGWQKWSKERKDAYVYGCCAKRGWVRGKGGHMVKK